MDTTGPEPQIEHWTSDDLSGHRDEVLDVYARAYRERLTGPFYTPNRYWSRLEMYAARDTFAMVAAYAAGELVGYALGYGLPSSTRWWIDLQTDRPAAFFVEDGTRTFALNELVVAPDRRRGYGRMLHDALLNSRPEERAALLVRPDNPASALYRKLGWQEIGRQQPFPDSPTFRSMVLPLTTR